MSNEVRNYDPEKLVATWGAIIMSGWISIVAKRDNPLTVLREGTNNGEATLIPDNRNSGTITVTLPQGNSANADISEAIVAAKFAGVKILKQPFLISDLSGAVPRNTNIAAPVCWLQTMPEVSFQAQDGSDMVYEFRTNDISMLLGGN